MVSAGVAGAVRGCWLPWGISLPRKRCLQHVHRRPRLSTPPGQRFMMERWKTMVEPTPRAVRLLMTDPETNEVLKAVLPPYPRHPRALLSLLEALAL